MNPVSSRTDGRRATVREIGEIGRTALPVVAALLAASPARASDALVLVPDPMFADPEWRFQWERPGAMRFSTDTVLIPVAFVGKFEVFRGRGVSGRRVVRSALFSAGLGAFFGAFVEFIATSDFCISTFSKLEECRADLGSEDLLRHL